MKRIFTNLFVAVLLMLSSTSWAQLSYLEVGQIYRFKSARADRSLAANGTDDVHVKATDVNDKKQEWYVTKDGDYYVLRNVACGKYLKGELTYYQEWDMTDDYSATENKFQLLVSNTTLNTLKTKDSNAYGHMHDNNSGDNGGYDVVGWLNGNENTGSHWTITKVNYTSEQIKALLDAAPTIAEAAAYDDALAAIFADAACTKLKDSYAAMSVEQIKADANYIALPATLQKTILKIKNDSWGEANADGSKSAWDAEYAKKFRVQMYEPYSIAGDITSWLGINAHANNDNPTGIYMPAAGTLYVMVEGEINPGATLRLVDAGSNDRITDAATDGIALQPGLNVINYTGSTGMLYICYNVDTYDPSGTDDAAKFHHKLSDFAPLKIHIEGGAINGFYNACGDFRATTDEENLWYTITGASVDKDADWVYMETRANLSVLPVLGHRQILLFSLGETEGNNGMAHYLPENITVPQTPYNRTKNWSDYGMGCDPKTGRINIMVEAWDRIMYSELATMGLVSKSDMAKMNEFYPRWNADGTDAAEIYDYSGASHVDGKTLEEFCGVDYSEVFNHHGVALGVGGSSYMYGSGDHCGYNHNTMNGVIETIASNAGSTWGPGHEIGHQHQALLTLNGLMEVTNNLFSNIALWYKGMSTSRYNGSDGSLEKVLEAFNTNGGDTYTNNIWALTHMYYRLWLYYHLAGNNTQFYPRLFELLRHDPMKRTYMQDGDVSMLHFYKLVCQAAGEDLTEFFRAHGYFKVMENRLVGDYSNSIYNVSQDMIDAAIAEVKAMNLKENLSIIFINDDDENANYLQHDGESKRVIYGETTPNSDFGSVSDFINGNVSVATNYTATLNSDGTLTMSGGTGGVGFLVLNEKGEIVSFSNKSTFALSDEAAYLLATGKASVVTVDTESTTTEAEVDVTAMRFALLQELIANAIALTKNTSETRVGFYKSSAVVNLQDYVTMAQEVIANGDLANLQAVYELLYNEYNAVVANEFSRVKFVPGSKYAIINKSGRIMSVLDDGKVTTVDGSSDYTSTEVNQWKLERDVAFRVKNVGKNAYLQEVTDKNGIRFTVAETLVDYNITEVGLGWYALACSKVPSRYMNKDGADATKVITWGSMGDDNSQWKFILLEENETNAVKEELLELSKKTLTLVNEVATVSYNEGSKINLQSDDNTAVNYIWSNAAVQGNDVDKLLDGNKDSFFHSQWNSSIAPSDGWGHHLTVYLGDNPSLTSFKFKFTTRNQSNLSNYPKTIEVYGSNVGGNDVANYTKLQAASGFATGKGVDNEVVVMGNGTAYRYLRFLVTDATGNNSGNNTGSDGMVFFHMSEFSIYPVTVSATVKSDYTSGVTVDAVLAAYNDAEQGKTVYNNASATLADINAKKTALGDGADVAGSYTTLLAQYNNLMNSVLNAKKEQLQTLIDETNTLIGSVGSVTIVPPAENELSLQVDNANGSYYLSTNSQESGDKRNIKNLIDGITNNDDVYFHTNWQESVGADHHLLLDMGDGNSLGEFTFKYTTRNNSAGIDAPKTIVVEGSNDNSSFTTIATLTGLPTGQHVTYTSETLGTNQNKYRYVRFRVTDGAGKVGGSYYYFAMSEFDVTELTEMAISVTNNSSVVKDDLLLDTYLATAKSQKLLDAATTVALLDAAIADQQAAYDALEKAKNTPADLDKAALQSLYGDALALYGEMADADGNVNANYALSALTNEKLVAVKTALDAAKAVLDNSNSQSEIDAAKTALQAQYDALLEIKNANVATTIDKSGLNTAIANANTLIAAIEAKGEGYYATTNLALDELQEALSAANDVATRFYLTGQQYTDALADLNTAYNTTNGIVALDCNSENRNNLATLIGNVNELLTTIADEGEITYAIPLQATNNTGSFYIWCNDPAGDSQGVAGLIDKNADGTANTGTFLGTDWGSDVPAYTHYIEVDFGATVTIDQLTMDYTTRNSTHADQRPNAIKILGSNDKVNYTDITEITSGLAADANEQWSMAESLDLCAHYRYIRVAVGSQRGFFHMADFNLYTKLSHTLKEYYTTAEGLDLTTLCFVLDEAKDAAAHYMTTEQYTAVYNKLSGCYTTADEIVDNDYNGNEEFAALKTDAEELLNDVVTINETETVIALQCDNENAPYYIFCNAPEKSTTYPGDNLGVAALLDVDESGEPVTSTHLHTAYSGNDAYDDLDHYLRVDMGEANLLSFKFAYISRSNTNNAPTEILIEGISDLEGGEWEEITTLINLPATAYSSGEITNGKTYRYIRFMVKTTVNNDVHNGHPYFAMSHFEMTACKTITISEKYASPNLPVDVAANAYNEVADANALDAEHYLPNEVGVAAKNELQDAKDALEAAIALKNIPVKLTTDVNNPVLYKIRINRSYAEYASLQYDASDSKVAVAAMEFATANAQSWYFMQGTDGCVLILPYTAGGNVLATNSFSEGNSKVVAKEKDTEGFSQNWEISKIDGKEWYNIKIKNTDGTYYYFSNHGGDGKKMGFYNSNASSDGGSMFKFILDEAYAIVEEAFASYGREPEYTDVPGYLATADYNKAYDAVAGYIENKNGEDADVFDAFDALKTAKTNATYVPSHIPEHGKVYRIMNLITNTETKYKYHYIANNNAAISFPTEPKTDGSDLWVCIQDGDKYKFVSALGTATLGWDYTIIETNAGAVKENATKFVVDDKTSVNGAKRIAESNNSMSLTNELWNSKGEALFNRAGNDGKAQSSNWSTDWYFQKVENADIKFKVKITKKFSSLYLPYSVVVPDGVGAFTAVDVDGTAVELVRVADKLGSSRHGTIIPARTPVVVYIEDENVVTAEYEFKYTTEDANLPEDVQSAVDNDAIIYGKILKTPVQCEDAYRYYKLGSKSSDEVAMMYWMYKEYNASGERLYPNTDDGTHISCTANKIYMKVPETLAAKSFTMRFAKGDGATDIDNVKEENGNVKTIYDLQGRKLSEITEPGIYIVDGKKVFVK